VEDLDRNVAIHIGLLGLVDRSHAAFADLLDDAELPSHLFIEIRIAHGNRLAPELEGGEESASKTNVIHIASAIRRCASCIHTGASSATFSNPTAIWISTRTPRVNASLGTGGSGHRRRRTVASQIR
jgi:hypothetical protein